jgi:hypothetical protein
MATNYSESGPRRRERKVGTASQPGATGDGHGPTRKVSNVDSPSIDGDRARKISGGDAARKFSYVSRKVSTVLQSDKTWRVSVSDWTLYAFSQLFGTVYMK